MIVVLERVEHIAANIKTFWFKPQRRLRYSAGQFIELYIPHDNPDQRGQKHWFTLSSSPTDELLAITTTFASGRCSTYKQTLLSLPLGYEVHMSDPLGDFVLPKDERIPLLFLAAGIGITPIHSMTKWLQDTDKYRDIRLIHSVSDTSQLAFQDMLTRYYGDRFMPIIGKKLTGQHLAELTGIPDQALYYLSGPEAMAQALATELQAQGIPDDHIVTDYFPGYPD